MNVICWYCTGEIEDEKGEDCPYCGVYQNQKPEEIKTEIGGVYILFFGTGNLCGVFATREAAEKSKKELGYKETYINFYVPRS